MSEDFNIIKEPQEILLSDTKTIFILAMYESIIIIKKQLESQTPLTMLYTESVKTFTGGFVVVGYMCPAPPDASKVTFEIILIT